MCSPKGAFLIGDPATVANKILNARDLLGGVGRITFQMSTASLETAAMKRSIELLGTEVAPLSARRSQSRDVGFRTARSLKRKHTMVSTSQYPRRSAAVTGAGGGLGRDIVLGLANKGYTVFGTAMSAAEVQDLKDASGGCVSLTVAI